MRMTLNVPDHLMSDLQKATGETNRTKLIRAALEEKLRRARRDQLLKLRGKLPLNLDLAAWRSKDSL